MTQREQKPGLIVSVDQVAYLRNGIGGKEPDPVHFALQAELAGCAGVCAHWRMDQRYVREQDLSLLNRMVKTSFFLQLAPSQENLHLLNELGPANVIFAGERRDEIEPIGVDATLLYNQLRHLFKGVDQRQSRLFLFLEPDMEQIRAAVKLEVAGIVLNPRDALAAFGRLQDNKAMLKLRDAVKLACKYGLEVHLASNIRHEHLAHFADIPGVTAIHIGRNLMAHALIFGIDSAIGAILQRLH